MSPQQPEHQLSSGNGLIYNFEVEDVDAEYTRLTDDGLSVIKHVVYERLFHSLYNMQCRF